MKKQYIIKDEGTRLYWGSAMGNDLWTDRIEFAHQYDSEFEAYEAMDWFDDGYYEIKTIFIK